MRRVATGNSGVIRGGGPPGGGTCAGFTLLELLAVVSILALLVGVAMPELRGALRDARGWQCGANLRLIEGAKDAFVTDQPGVALTNESQLGAYLKYGLPACPAGGAYGNVASLYGRAACSLNFGVGGTIEAFPEESPNGTNFTVNGYHDMGPR